MPHQKQSSGPAVLSLPKPQPDSAAPAASLSANSTPPELELGSVAVVIDEAGLIVAAEPICAPLFQWQPAELVGQPLEVLLVAGTDQIRARLVPDQATLGPDSEAPPRLFALAQRKDGTSFPVAVRLELRPPAAGCWWAVAFHAVNSPPAPQSERPAVGILHSISSLRRRRAQVAAPLALESIPDIFQRAPVEPAAPQLDPPGITAPAAPVAPEPSVPIPRMQLAQEQLAPAAPAAEPAWANAEARLHELEQQQGLSQSAEGLKGAQAESRQRPAPSPAPTEDEPALQDQLLDLEARLRTAVASLARATAELETERGQRSRSEQRAATLTSRMQQLHEDLKNHLETERADHEHLAQLEHQLHEQARQNDLTVIRLQSALQLEQSERKRLEAELRSRLLSTDSARAGRALVNSLRRQLQPAVETLHHSACRLLQLELSDDQKQLVQTILENSLLLQTSLQESPQA